MYTKLIDASIAGISISDISVSSNAPASIFSILSGKTIEVKLVPAKAFTPISFNSFGSFIEVKPEFSNKFADILNKLSFKFTFSKAVQFLNVAYPLKDVIFSRLIFLMNYNL